MVERCPHCGGPLEGWAGEHHSIQCPSASSPAHDDDTAGTAEHNRRADADEPYPGYRALRLAEGAASLADVDTDTLTEALAGAVNRRKAAASRTPVYYVAAAAGLDAIRAEIARRADPDYGEGDTATEEDARFAARIAGDDAAEAIACRGCGREIPDDVESGRDFCDRCAAENAGAVPVVFDLEARRPMPLGLYVRDDEDVIVFETPAGTFRSAPADCVSIVHVNPHGQGRTA